MTVEKQKSTNDSERLAASNGVFYVEYRLRAGGCRQFYANSMTDGEGFRPCHAQSLRSPLTLGYVVEDRGYGNQRVMALPTMPDVCFAMTCEFGEYL